MFPLILCALLLGPMLVAPVLLGPVVLGPGFPGAILLGPVLPGTGLQGPGLQDSVAMPGSARGAELPDASPVKPSPAFVPAGPLHARGALVWLPGVSGRDAPGPPNEPDLVGRMAARGLDIWRFDRARGQDPIAGSSAALVHAISILRAAGYRRIVVAGHSRGAWIALTALAHPGAADAVIAVSVGAHGTRPEAQAQAMADWSSLWKAADSSGTRVALVQLADDPYDSDPARRLAIAKAEAARAGVTLLPVFQPGAPRGHIGVYEPSFDDLLGEAIAAFADGG